MSRTLGKGYKITCYPIGNNLVTKKFKKRKSVNLVKTCWNLIKPLNGTYLEQKNLKTLKH
jgi:hypothetical protein